MSSGKYPVSSLPSRDQRVARSLSRMMMQRYPSHLGSYSRFPGSARGIFVTARARATFTGGASPSGSPLPAGYSAVAIEAFERVDLDGVQQFTRAVAGGTGEFIEGDEPGPGQGDG